MVNVGVACIAFRMRERLHLITKPGEPSDKVRSDKAR